MTEIAQTSTAPDISNLTPSFATTKTRLGIAGTVAARTEIVGSASITSGNVDQSELLLADIVARMGDLTKLPIWTDDDQQKLENQIDVILWRDTATTITDDVNSLAHRLWNSVLETNSRLLRWEFVSALRRLNSAEAVALEDYVIGQLLSSSSAGDRVAAIESLWSRDRQRALKRFKKLRLKETDPTALAIMRHYLGEDDAKDFSSAA